MTVITMSRTELSRLRVMIDLADGRTRVEDAASLMGLQRRQVYRLLDAFRAHGPDALISKRRGKPSNRAHGAVFRQTCVAIVRERYEDFGPTLAAEKLAEVHGLPIGVETLRQWMIEVRHQGVALPYRTFDRITRVDQGAIVENKRLSEAPARTARAKHMLSVG
jgi:transposase